MSGAVDLLMFSGLLALGQFSPGPDMILLTRTALKSGVRTGMKVALGTVCGVAVHATAAVAGLALACERLPVLREAMRWLAAGYLLWLAYGLLLEWRSARRGEVGENGPEKRPFVRGLLCNLLNPKALIFLVAVSAPFLRGDLPGWWAFAIWGIMVGQGWVLWSLWAWLLQWEPLKLRYERAARWIDGAFGIVLVALAVRLIVG